MTSNASPFENVYRQAGAGSPPGDGRMPPVVTSFAEEYEAATTGALALDRSHRGRLRISGRDRESFLHNMLSNDVRGLAIGAGVPAAFLTNKGKLVADLLLFKMADAMIADVERVRIEPLRSALDRYVISEDVVLEDRTGGEVSFSVEGPVASSILGGLMDARKEGAAPASEADLEGLSHLGVAVGEILGTEVIVTAHRRESTPRYDVSAPLERASEILERVLDRGARLGGELVAETRRLEAGRPRFGIDLDESRLPLEAGLDEAISFQKGCYIGQEYVVRLAHRGHLNRKLMGLLVEGPEVPPPASVVRREGEEVGTVTSSAMSPAFGRALALAYLKREAFEPGTRVSLPGGVEAVVSALPFPRPSGRVTAR